MPHPILDRPEVLRVVFHPRRDPGLFLRPGARRVSVEVEPGIAIGGRLYSANPAAPLLLYFHGNGEIAADYDGIAPLYLQLGVTLLVMDYRGYGTSGGMPTASHLLTDAVITFMAVDDLLERYKLAPASLYLMGRSLGSAAALEVAQHAGQRLAGLIIESGFADTFALLARLGVRIHGMEDAHDGFGNQEKVSRVTVPTLIIHGEEDVLIPPSDGRTLYQHAAAAEKKLLLIPYAGHNDVLMVGRRLYFAAIQDLIFGEARSGGQE